MAGVGQVAATSGIAQTASLGEPDEAVVQLSRPLPVVDRGWIDGARVAPGAFDGTASVERSRNEKTASAIHRHVRPQ